MAVVSRFRDLAGAEVASATLEAAGIMNSLADTYFLGLAWHDSIALGWIRLHVRDSDAEEARDLLELPTLAEWPTQWELEVAEKSCPTCHSVDLALESGPRKTLVLMILTVVPLWFWRSRLSCRNCGFSQRVPLRFRPDLVVVWLAAATIVVVFTALVCLVFGYAIFGRRA